MSAKHSIILGIEQRVLSSKAPNYKSWRIGITNEWQQRYADWGKPPHFLYWQADSLEDAQAIETHFIHQKGMEGGTGGDLSARKSAFVYIF